MNACFISKPPKGCNPGSLVSLAAARVAAGWIKDSFMVGPSRNSLVVGTPKHTRVDPAAQHPWRPDPTDDRTPIGPGDVITSVDHAASRYPIIVGFTFAFMDLIIKAHEHGPQQRLIDLNAVGGSLADRHGLFQQGFGFRHFHGSTVGRLAVK